MGIYMYYLPLPLFVYYDIFMGRIFTIIPAGPR
jgi:hypothetical protein